MKAETTLLHVLADPVYYSSFEYSPIMGFAGMSTDIVPGPEPKELRNEAKKFLEKSKSHLGDPSIEVTVIDGNVAEEILKAAKNIHADIIVMGSHSRRGLEKILMGSVTEKVLHHSLIPLFIVPTKKEE